ncbi:DNA topoisomerase III [Marinomonas algicola]|uniref:DNA topoisomerase III n=1 Tax=Marinomonas algicola TaxID=2773454 RepID=UPI00174CEA4A|nr:DNA topoisomerase III [Marinomonas algicola]
MILYIAEKPSVGRAVADVLPKPHQKGDGYIRVANGDTVTWCIGHLLEQAEPEAYNSDYKKWRKEDLPIIPEKWKHQVKPQTKKQFSVVKKLINEADLLVNMGDPDRVGQILVDEVINYAGVSKTKRESTKRCLISDLNPAAIKKSLNNLRNNTDFIPLATSALARARADWLYGINMTRLCTLQGQRSGYNGVLSIGRVQTPVLGLVVHRDQEIARFISKPFYDVFVLLETTNGEQYQAKWKPSEACSPYMDEEGRVLSKKLVGNVLERVSNQVGRVTRVNTDKKKQPAPLPYNLSTLQIEASKRFNLNAQETLDTCQQLYERHKLITYPRSDCRYLPIGHLEDKHRVTQSIKETCPALNEAVENANLKRKSKAWNDSKVSAHHAIIPTSKSMDPNRLTKNEKCVYELISRQYLIQFYPDFEYAEKQIDHDVAGGLFIAKQKDILHQGWKALFPSKKAEEKENAFSEKNLPAVSQGDQVTCLNGRIDEKNTSPPKHFTDATLLSAMTGIARYVQDIEIKKVLRETDGLGTEATRAGIIELLFKRQFLTKKGKEIHSTDVGRQLINSLPSQMVLPDMTAHWESQLEAISDKRMNYAQFMQPLTNGLTTLISQVGEVTFSGMSGMGKKFTSRKRKTPRKNTRSQKANT